MITDVNRWLARPFSPSPLKSRNDIKKHQLQEAIAVVVAITAATLRGPEPMPWLNR